VRGFRIELGEIEAQLRSQPSVRDAVVLAREDGAVGNRLVGYVVPSGDPLEAGVERSSLAGELTNALRKVLPDYMIPSGLVVLAQLPLTPNGKVDRGALAVLEERGSRSGELVAPRTYLERRLCEIWQEALGVESVGIDDNFFDLGGHSLLVIRLVSKINANFGIRLSPRRIFENPSVRRLARVLDGPEVETPGEWEPLLSLSEETGAPRLYCVPGAGVSSAALAPLARALAGRAVLNVLEARGSDGVSSPQASVAEMVESYGSAIKRHQACGPYHLAGHSFGGCVVLELARWFEAKGDTVSVVMLDSFLDFFSTGDASPLSPREKATALAGLLGKGESEIPDGMDESALSDWMALSLRDSGLLPEGEPESALRGFMEVFLSQLEMQRGYRPSGRVQAPITLLYAEDGAMAGERLSGVLSAYARVAEQPVRHFAVRGGHLSMLSAPNASRLAERLLAETL
jgi:thioesterase domain-containing protein/acyl carrier protein